MDPGWSSHKWTGVNTLTTISSPWHFNALLSSFFWQSIHLWPDMSSGVTTGMLSLSLPSFQKSSILQKAASKLTECTINKQNLQFLFDVNFCKESEHSSWANGPPPVQACFYWWLGVHMAEEGHGHSCRKDDFCSLWARHGRWNCLKLHNRQNLRMLPTFRNFKGVIKFWSGAGFKDGNKAYHFVSSNMEKLSLFFCDKETTCYIYACVDVSYTTSVEITNKSK